jgi:hypothetical protein
LRGFAERQRTADLREALGKLQRLQSADDAEVAKAKAALEVLQQKEGESVTLGHSPAAVLNPACLS